MPLARYVTGSRVRSCLAKDSPFFRTGTVLGITHVGLMVRVRWDAALPGKYVASDVRFDPVTGTVYKAARFARGPACPFTQDCFACELVPLDAPYPPNAEDLPPAPF